MDLASGFKNSPSLVAITQLESGRFVDMNPAFARVLGFSREEILGKTPLELAIWDDPVDRQSILARLRAGGSVVNEPVTFRTRDKKPYDGLITVELLHHHNQQYVFSLIQDISVHNELKARAAQAEQSYRTLVREAAEGIYRSSPSGGFIEVNPAFARMLGYQEPDDLIQVIDRASDRLYVNQDWGRQVVARLLKQGRIHGVESELYRKDGSTIWVSENARVVLDANGKPQFFEGTIIDVTERRLAQRALRFSEQRYRALVDQNQMGVFSYEDGAYSYVNEAFARLLGYRRDEIVGQSFAFVVAAEDLDAARERHRRRVAGEPVASDADVRLVHKDGSIIHTTISVASMNEHDRVVMIGAIRDVTEQKLAEWQLQHNATHDPLTELPNRTLFLEQLNESLDQTRQHPGSHSALLFMDLNGFKIVNDSLGHVAGDRLLIAIARRLRTVVEGKAMVARYGGDEFTLVPLQSCDADQAAELAEQVLSAFTSPFDLGKTRVYSGASIGIVVFGGEYRSSEELMRDADTAMYRAKEGGQSGYRIFNESMHRMARQRLRIETELRQAVERQEFRVAYQPIIELENGRIHGFESLVRWQHPVQGLLRPQHFLKVAEETGLIESIDWWVLETACRQMAQWQSDHPESAPLQISVNIDDHQFSHQRLLQTLEGIINRTGIEPASLNLEITESVFRDNPAHTRQILASLKSVGVGLYVDDFGTGFSSLSSFSDASFDLLKIDGSFIRDMEKNDRHRAIVKTIIQFANDLELGAIAECVETHEQAEMLADMGCNLVQGHFFSRALNPARASVLLRGSTENLHGQLKQWMATG